jgi:hypothetical protein
MMRVVRLGLGRSPDGHLATEPKPVFHTDESALARESHGLGKARMAVNGTPLNGFRAASGRGSAALPAQGPRSLGRMDEVTHLQLDGRRDEGARRRSTVPTSTWLRSWRFSRHGPAEQRRGRRHEVIDSQVIVVDYRGRLPRRAHSRREIQH